MTRVSIASLRLSNPSVEVTVVCDGVSGEALRSSGDLLLSEIDEFVVSGTPQGDAVYRNRHVKTRLREVIHGSFLFLDSDTFVRGDLSPIFSIDGDVAGARNHSRDEFWEQVWEQDSKTLTLMKWNVGEHVYVNGGVFFYNETPGAHRFASLWHKKWLDQVEKGAGHRDQPALNSALFDAEPRLDILPHRFNSQFKVAPHSVRDAVIWHFYATCSSETPMTALELFIDRVLGGERLCRDTIAQMIQRPHPWRRQSRLDDWMANCLSNNGWLNPGYQAWFQGHRAVACRYWAVHTLRRNSARLRRFYPSLRGSA